VVNYLKFPFSVASGTSCIYYTVGYFVLLVLTRLAEFSLTLNVLHCSAGMKMDPQYINDLLPLILMVSRALYSVCHFLHFSRVFYRYLFLSLFSDILLLSCFTPVESCILWHSNLIICGKNTTCLFLPYW